MAPGCGKPRGEMSQNPKSCCSPTREGEAPAPPEAPRAQSGADHLDESVLIPGGTAYLGTDHPILAIDGETPFRKTKLKPFRIGRGSVTNSQFTRFVEETGFVTEAERWGWSYVFQGQVPAKMGLTQGVPGLDWWRRVDGANWREINGPGTADRVWHPDHPVVQVSWNDAVAYAKWAGGRLPTEAEWEHAARGGQLDARFPWGDAEPDDEAHFPCNIWQGRFPGQNTGADGYVTTAPAESYQPNGYGLYNVCGNVWEWTGDNFRLKSLKREAKQRMAAQKGWKLLKGGSFLCHASYCYRYRIAARSSNAPDTSTTHQGFRVVWPEAG